MAIYHLKVISRLRKLTEEMFEIIQFLNCYNVQITKRKKEKRKKERKKERQKERKKAGKKERQKEKYTRERKRESVLLLSLIVKYW